MFKMRPVQPRAPRMPSGRAPHEHTANSGQSQRPHLHIARVVVSAPVQPTCKSALSNATVRVSAATQPSNATIRFATVAYFILVMGLSVSLPPQVRSSDTPLCPEGYWQNGKSRAELLKEKAGPATFQDDAFGWRRDADLDPACQLCPKDSRCPLGAKECIACGSDNFDAGGRLSFAKYLKLHGNKIPPQTYQDEMGQSECKQCPPGALVDTTNRDDGGMCTCAAGYYEYYEKQASANSNRPNRTSYLDSVPDGAPSHQYAGEVDLASSSIQSRMECIPCPPRSTSNPGAKSIEACTCLDNYFRDESFRWDEPCQLITRPPQPDKPNATSISDTEIYVEWWPASSANGPILESAYELYVDGKPHNYNNMTGRGVVDGKPLAFIAMADAAAADSMQAFTAVIGDDLLPATEYCVSVKAFTAGGGTLSTPQCVTTRPAGCKRGLSLPGTFTLPNGTFQDCRAGTYADKCGMHECTPCLPGLYQPNTGASSVVTCLACPAGFHSPSGSATCSTCGAHEHCPRASPSTAHLLSSWANIPPKSPLVRLQDSNVVEIMPKAEPVVVRSGMTAGGLALLWLGVFAVLFVVVVSSVVCFCPAKSNTEPREVQQCGKVASILRAADFVFTSVLRDVEVTIGLPTKRGVADDESNATRSKAVTLGADMSAPPVVRCAVKKTPSLRRATITILYFAAILAAAGYLTGDWMNTRYIEVRSVVPMYNAAGDVISPPPGLSFRIVLLGSQLTCEDANVTVRALDTYSAQTTAQPVDYTVECTAKITQGTESSDEGETEMPVGSIVYSDEDLMSCGTVGGASCIALTLKPNPLVRIYRTQSVSVTLTSTVGQPVWAQAMRVWASVPSWQKGVDSWVEFGAPSPTTARAAANASHATDNSGELLSGQVFTAPVALSHAFLTYNGDEVRSRGFELYLSGEPATFATSEPVSFLTLSVPVTVSATETKIDVVEQRTLTDLLARIFSFIGAIGTASALVIAIAFKWPTACAWAVGKCIRPMCQHVSDGAQWMWRRAENGVDCICRCSRMYRRASVDEESAEQNAHSDELTPLTH